MPWIIAGVAYAAAYAVLTVALQHAPLARLWAGNLGLLVSPLVPIAVVLRRRHEWRGRHLVFFDAIAVGAALWFAGQIAWATKELFLRQPQPWIDWDIVPQLCGAMMPLLALIAAPHRDQRRDLTPASALDIYGLLFFAGYVCWALIIAPGLAPGHAASGLRMVSTLGPAVRTLALVGLMLAYGIARGTPWAEVYRLLATGVGLSLVFLLAVSARLFSGEYQTGSVPDIGWIIPFWFYAAAAAEAPASPPEPRVPIVSHYRPGPPLLLFSAILLVPIVSLATDVLMPLGDPVDHYRDVAAHITMFAGLALAMLRIAADQRVARRFEGRIRLLAAACEQTKELIAITRGHAVEYANAAFCRAFGYEQHEMMTLDRRVLVADASDEKARTILDTLGRSETVTGTLLMKRRDGSTFLATLSAAPIAHEDGGSPHYVAVVRDLTDENEMREQLVRGERLSAVGELVSSIAHQINNPLQSVVGMVDVLLVSPESGPLHADLERVRAEARRAGHIIRNLLAFARKAAGERLLGELPEMIDGTLSLCAYELESAHIHLVREYDADLPLVLVNREDFQQAMLNLLTNAQQSIAAAGRSGTIAVRALARGSDAVIEVQDDGPGVPADLATRIFEPFVTTKGVSAASGFGLSTAFAIVAAHGGTLELAPAVSGACFRITLPGAGFAGPVVRTV